MSIGFEVEMLRLQLVEEREADFTAKVTTEREGDAGKSCQASR
jgi:hypothetical protein